MADAVEHIRWRLWHGQTRRALRLIQRTLAAVKGRTKNRGSRIGGEADEGIDRAGDLRVRARLDDEPFFTSPTEGAVQWLLHRRMGAQQQMRWSPRGAHLMLQVRTAIVNGTFDEDHLDICRHRRSFRMAA